MSDQRPIDLLLERIEGVEKSGKGFMGFCKAHPDGARSNRRSLSFWETEDGACAVNCFAGCSSEAIWRAVGLQLKDMFPRKEGDKTIPVKKKRGPATKTHTYKYTDEDGRELFCVDRFKPKDPKEPKYFEQWRHVNGALVMGLKEGWYNPGKGRFSNKWWLHQGKNDITDRPFVNSQWFPEARRVLYMLPKVLRARDSGEEVWFCEGEKDAHAVEAKGATATTCPGGSGNWRPEFGESLRGCQVCLVRDNDEPGYKRVARTYEALTSIGCVVRVVAPAEGKDAWDHLDAGYGLDEFMPVEPHEKYVKVEPVATEAVELKVVDGGSEPPVKSASIKKEKEPPKYFPHTDLGNAERLISARGEDLRYCHKFGSWLLWDKSRWAVDETGGSPIRQVWRTVIRELYDEGKALSNRGGNDKSRGVALMEWARKCEGSSKVNAMLEWAKALPGVPVTPDDLDANPEVFGVPNGVLDLRTGSLREARRDDLITKQGGIPYQEGEESDEFEDWLLTALGGDMELFDHVMHAIGYMLTGSVKEQSFFFAQGPGGGGKGTLAALLTGVMGDYMEFLRSESLMQKAIDAIPTDIAKLKGARIALVDETPQEKRFNESLLKVMTGGGKITGRFMREDEFSYLPNFKLMILGNNRPKFINFDKAIERRMKLWPFTNPVPNDQIRKDFTEKMVERQLSGFFSLSVKYAKSWYGAGIPRSRKVDEAVGFYQHESDSVGRFIEEECVCDANYRIEPMVLYTKFVAWAKRGGDYPISNILFGNELDVKGHKRFSSNGKRYYRGLMLRETGEGGYEGDPKHDE